MGPVPKIRSLVVALCLGTVAAAGDPGGWFQEPAAPGPHLHPTAADLARVPSLAADGPVVGTYLFYWYCARTNAHLRYADGADACTTHPPTWEDYTFRSARWWAAQFRDIAAAGIDLAALVYWGTPGAYDEWSFVGLPPMVEALDGLDREGASRPRVALFYDTSTLAQNPPARRIDLSTDEGKAWFYCSIRDFFSLVPPRHWAALAGRPLVFLYSPAFAAKQDPAVFPYVRKRFREDFGVEPCVVAQTSWEGEPDLTCDWGGALGLKLAGCAALGPGYDHSAVRGRAPLVRDREGGRFYARAWETLLALHPARRPRLAMVETWNEFHEGTEVAPSLEHGRAYLEATRRYADLFHAGRRILPATPYSSEEAVWATLGPGGVPHGIATRAVPDGALEEGTVAGRACVTTAPSAHPARYAYFDVDDGFAFDLDPSPLTLTVDYLDAGCAYFRLEYDGADGGASVRGGAFTAGGRVRVAGSGAWKTAAFDLSDARMANRCNGADFRLAVEGGERRLSVARVYLRKAPR